MRYENLTKEKKKMGAGVNFIDTVNFPIFEKMMEKKEKEEEKMNIERERRKNVEKKK